MDLHYWQNHYINIIRINIQFNTKEECSQIQLYVAFFKAKVQNKCLVLAH